MRAQRDKFGDIILPHDPAEGLPPEVLSGLERWVFGADELVGVARCEGLADLLMEWGNLDDPFSVQEWVQANRARLAPDVVATGVTDVAEQPQGSVLSFLVDQLLLAEPDDRALRTSSLRELSAEWYSALIDPEKLLGHLLRTHQERSLIRKWSDERLARRHAELHLAVGNATSQITDR